MNNISLIIDLKLINYLSIVKDFFFNIFNKLIIFMKYIFYIYSLENKLNKW